MRFVNDWRAGKTTLKEAINRDDEKPSITDQDIEKLFLDKVERELGLPEYTLFSMLTML